MGIKRTIRTPYQVPIQTWLSIYAARDPRNRPIKAGLHCGSQTCDASPGRKKLEEQPTCPIWSSRPGDYVPHHGKRPSNNHGRAHRASKTSSTDNVNFLTHLLMHNDLCDG